MNKYFPKLSQTEVFIQTGEDGSGFNCKMLPISALGELNACVELLQSDDFAKVEEARNRMIALAKTVIPSEYHEGVERFDVAKASELIAYLMYGDDDDQPRESKKK